MDQYMKFFKSLFSKTDPKEEVKEKLLELDIGDKAVLLPELIDEENFHLVRDVASELIEAGKLNGQLIGKKGWFLPDADAKLKEVWSKLERGKVDLKDIATLWDINAKRVYIALEDYAAKLNLEEPIFHRDELDLYLVSYFKKAWYDILSAYDEEDEVEFETLIKNSKIAAEAKSIFKKLVSEWLAEGKLEYVLGADGKVRPTRVISDLIEEYVPEAWESGKTVITYEELAEKYGMARKEIGKILQKLIDDRALGEVTLYATDEMIKPRL